MSPMINRKLVDPRRTMTAELMRRSGLTQKRDSPFVTPLPVLSAATGKTVHKTVNSTVVRLNKTDYNVSQAQREHADKAT